MKSGPQAKLWIVPIAAFSVWMLYFMVIYAAHSVGCARGWLLQDAGLGLNALSFALAALTLAAAGSIAWMARGARSVARDTDTVGTTRFAARLALLASAVAIVSTLWVGLPVALVPSCQ
jgi:hypothetical protein